MVEVARRRLPPEALPSGTATLPVQVDGMRTSVEHCGCRLAYEVQGSGPPIVFIQGVGVHGRGWMPQVSTLSSRYECLIFDNRGMGLSQPLGASISVELMARDTLCLLDHLGWQSCHVVAHSLGGPVALQLALTQPSRVRSLSLLCTVARGSDATRLTWRLLQLGLRSRIGTRAMRRRAFLEIVLPPGVVHPADVSTMAADLEPLFGHDIADQPPVAMKQLAALRAFDVSDRLQEITGIPALVVSAEHDPIAPPRYGRELASRIIGSRYVEIPNASHGVPIYQPAEINTLLVQHIAVAEQGRLR